VSSHGAPSGGRRPSGGDRQLLVKLAAELGVATSYRDVFGGGHTASADSLQAVIGSLLGVPGAGAVELAELAEARRRAEAERLVPPVVVAWVDGDGPGKAIWLPVATGPAHSGLHRSPTSLAVQVTPIDVDASPLAAEVPVTVGPDGTGLDLGGLGLGIGRYSVRVADGGPGATTTLVVAPVRLPGFGTGARLWGVFAPAWSLWTRRRPEAHLGSLDAVGEWIGRHGGQLVGTLPMLATYLASPLEPSPYAPVSRHRWNEALVDLDACPGIDQCIAAGEQRNAVLPSDPAAPHDAVAHWQALRPVLESLASHAWRDPALRHQMEDAVRADPGLRDYARFRAATDRTRTGWHAWPDAASNDGRRPLPKGIGDDDPDVRFWLYAQSATHRQMVGLGRRLAERGQRLYLDLSLGAHGDGYDTWAQPELFGWGAAVGAPPDEMFTGGQNWGFPPVRPDVARLHGHDHLAEALRAHMSVCGVLRIDHVMGLQRLFWVPDGMTSADGVYVHQPMEEFMAVLAVESWRSGTVVIGENLGTVDPGVERAMDRHGLLGMYVGQFEAPASASPMALPGANQLASMNTHDMPSFAGWIATDDAFRRRDMGLLDGDGVDAQRRIRVRQVEGLRREVTERGLDPGDGNPVALLAGVVEMLGATEAPAVLVSVDDLVGATEPQNVPGTPSDRPNWVLRLPVPAEDLAADPAAQSVLDRLDASRRDGLTGGSPPPPALPGR
jgi:4-alpha-glucanotransferase